MAPPIKIGFPILLRGIDHLADYFLHGPLLKEQPRRPYCSSVGSSSFNSSGGMITAAATLSSGSRLSRRTPCVARPAARMVLVSMRMILPHWLMTISSLVSFTSKMEVVFPTLGVALRLVTPCAP